MFIDTDKLKYPAIMLVALAIIAVVGLLFWKYYYQLSEDSAKKALVLQTEQLANAKLLSDALKISEMNANELKAEYEKALNKTPVASFQIQAPSLEIAAEKVTGMINSQDKSLPPAALEKTERTAVVVNNSAQKVDVMKIDLDKDWEISTGIGSQQGNTYIPIGVQRNYVPDKGWAVEAHLSAPDLASGRFNINGWEVRHVWRF